MMLLLAPATAAAKTQTFDLRSGPYTVGRYDTVMVSDEVRTPPLKGWVTDMHAELVDQDGRAVPVDEAMLHHVFFHNLDRLRSRGNCAAQIPEVFYGTGEEDQSLDLPEGYGYRLRDRDHWRMGAMLMSHRYVPEQVWVRYEVEVTTVKQTGVRPLWVRANGCGDSSSYNVAGGGAPGSVDDQTFRWRVPLTGRIVAAGGHLHAGALGLQLRDPACGNRVLFDNRPSFAPADALVYRARPLLHEPGPTQTSWFSSQTGIPVRKGQRLDLHGLYENDHARGAVMAITHIYVAPRRRAPGGCPPLPSDATQSPPRPGQREHAVYQPIPLHRLDEHRRVVDVAKLAGDPAWPQQDPTVELSGYRFQPERLTIRAGSTVRWNFDDVAEHNLTFASGPRALGGVTGDAGDVASARFRVPGRYQFFCYLHPMTMHQQVDVVG
jgi:plastocyanin